MIDSQESSLIGRWLSDGSRVVADETCHRIDRLVADHLVLIGHSPDGWSTLFRDPSDGRLWERTYPDSHSHGAGPPSLCCVSLAQARAAYGYEA